MRNPFSVVRGAQNAMGLSYHLSRIVRNEATFLQMTPFPSTRADCSDGRQVEICSLRGISCALLTTATGVCSRKNYEVAGMLREAERQFKSSLEDQDMVVTYLELAKVSKLANQSA